MVHGYSFMTHLGMKTIPLPRVYQEKAHVLVFWFRIHCHFRRLGLQRGKVHHMAHCVMRARVTGCLISSWNSLWNSTKFLFRQERTKEKAQALVFWFRIQCHFRRLCLQRRRVYPTSHCVMRARVLAKLRTQFSAMEVKRAKTYGVNRGPVCRRVLSTWTTCKHDERDNIQTWEVFNLIKWFIVGSDNLLIC